MDIEFIDKYFIENYLTCGKTYDNFIFEKCPTKFLKTAKELLKEIKNGVKAITVSFSDKEEANFESTIHFLDKFYSKILARDYVCSKIFIELLKDNTKYVGKCKNLERSLNSILTGDIDNAIGFHCEAPIPAEIIDLSNRVGKIELNIFMENTKNIYFQQVINTFISMRTPFSIKLFTNNEKLTTYYDQSGCLIECPHDFMRRQVTNYNNIDEQNK